MKKQLGRILSLTLILVIIAGAPSAAIPIEPVGTGELDYLELLLDVIEEYYVDEIDSDVLVEGAFRGVFDQLDQYSTYFSPEEYQRYNESAGGSFGGVGITVTKDIESDYIKVISPIEDTPGARAGIQTNDLIIAVDGQSLKGATLEEAVEIMRGEAGTSLKLTIQRPGLADTLIFEIVREIIEVNPVKFEIREDGIVNFRLKSFNEHSAKDVKAALEEIKKDRNVKGMVIDLRNNPGGRLDQVIDIADMFLEKGKPIVQVDYRAYSDNIFEAEEAQMFKLPVAVLINQGSASASEILAGALQDNGRATIIGHNSFGKGTVQSVTDLSNGGGIKLTIAEYLTANGNKVNGVGIKPDIEIENLFGSGLMTNADFAPMIEKEDNVLGDTGLNVYGAQQRLDYIGYTLPLTGAFDEATQTQLLAFQKQMGIEATGTLNQETRVNLYNVINNPEQGLVDSQLEKAVEILKNPK